jgi:3-phenylpropionate/trans-cinnamate dioxygenase ferredoxin subunit
VTKHVVGPVDELPPGDVRRVRFGGRAVAIFNVDGTFYALKDVCPHQGAPLSEGVVVSELSSTRPGEYAFRADVKHVRCPWHGWEYDLATGQSWYAPGKDRVRTFDVEVEPGSRLLACGREPGPYVAETLTVTVEDDYVVVEL